MSDVRKPAVAGQFYEAGKDQCIAEIEHYIDSWMINVELPDYVTAGIVPHAGWVFSGDLAGAVFSVIQQINGEVDTFIIFGAAHRYFGNRAAVYDSGMWYTPLSEVEIDSELAEQIISTDCAIADKASHSKEHSIEVQVPFIQYLFPKAKIVPVLVPCSELSLVLGEEVGDVVQRQDKKVVCIASTDLTHYGPMYGFYPQGVGEDAIAWAKNVNDKSFIDLAVDMRSEELLKTSEENASACGPGASAALINYAKRMGKNQGVLLGHTHSNEILKKKHNQTSQESVGYAAIVY